MSYGLNPLSNSQSLAADAQSLGNLKMEAGKATPAAIRETAKQFESLFMRELLKSMREATVKSGMLDNQGSDLGTDMLDQQFAVQMSGQPGGLSDLIAQQLSRQMGVADASSKATGSVGAAGSGRGMGSTFSAPTNGTLSKTSKAPTESQTQFVQKHMQAAKEVEKTSGIPAEFMLGQAGHETGWGKRDIKNKDGSPSFNLFGIKAGPSWKGKVAEITTTEYVNGVAEKRVAKFRAYDSVADSFKDYAKLISQSPRYAKAYEQTGSAHAYASGLQKAGYATDPEYASKLSRAINTTLQIRRAQA
jgi:peptidoglycan hydrolase FlgJ